MPGPFIFIATNELKPGAFDVERRRAGELSTFLAEHEPRLIAFNEYANDAGTEVAVVQVHADSDSMEFHMNVVREQAERAYAETLEATASIQVFGTPSPAVLEMLRTQAGAGVPTSVTPLHLAGFTRTASS